MSKLKVNKVLLPQAVPGLIAEVVREDTNGAFLVIQSGKNSLEIKISDVVQFIQEQDAATESVPTNE